MLRPIWWQPYFGAGIASAYTSPEAWAFRVSVWPTSTQTIVNPPVDWVETGHKENV